MRFRYVLEMILLAALFGTAFFFMRLAVPEFGPVALAEFRILLAGLFLLPIWWLQGGADALQDLRENWREILIVGLLNSGLPFMCYAYAMLSVTSGYAAILNATAPLWGALVAWAWLGDRITLRTGIGLMLGFLGVILLVSSSKQIGVENVFWGTTACVLAAFLYGVAANYTLVKLAKVPAMTIATFSLLMSALTLLPLALIYAPSTPISNQSWAAAVALGVLSTACSTALYFRLIAIIGATRAITVAFLIPVFGAYWGWLFLDEQISLSMLVGCAIILLGTALATDVIGKRKA